MPSRSVIPIAPIQVNGTQGRSGGSRRSRSAVSIPGVRSRSRHRESRVHSHSRSRFRFKHKERNFPAAICSMVSIVILCVTMAEPKWVSLKGGGCSLLHNPRGSLHYLGVFQFFYNGKFLLDEPAQLSDLTRYQYGPSERDVLVNCVDSKAVLLFKVVIAFSFLTVLSSLAAFLLDLTGPSGRALQRMHRSAIFNIISVAFCVVMNIFCYLITSVVESLQNATKQYHGSKVEITFDVSFYLITAAGSISIIAIACNCFRRYPVYEESSYQRFEDCEDIESLLAPHLAPDMAPMSNMPPPPAYTPSANMPSLSAVTPEPSLDALAAIPTPTVASSTHALSVNA